MTSIDELSQLIRKIAPADIASRPVYVCFASQVVDVFPIGPSTWGFHGTCLDVALADWLRESNQWRGRGPAIVVNDQAIADDVGELAGADDDFASELIRSRLLGVTLHEAAHALATPLDLRPVPDEIAESVTKQARECVIGFTKEKQITEAPSEIASWSGHEAHFIRTLLHVANRAENILCEPLVSRFLFSHHNYDLSAFSVYKRALQKEIEAFDYSMTFADLRACQPPQAFVHLWKNDLHEWWSQTQTDTRTAQLVAAVAPYVNVQSSQGTEE